MDITLGLDIGTHQTKIALSYTPNNESIFEFVEFKSSNGDKTYMLPSIVQINNDDTLSYGICDQTKAKKIPKVKPKRIAYPSKPKPKTVVSLQRIPYPLAPVKYHKVQISKHMTAREVSPQYENWQMECKKIDEKNKRNQLEFEKCLEKTQRELSDWKLKCEELDQQFNERMDLYNSPDIYYNTFRYFKLACFSDQKVEPFSEDYSPEKLMIWYTTYILLYVKQYVKERFGESFEESVSVQMGIPSGFNNDMSRVIESKAKQLLVAARELMDNFNSMDQFLSTDVNTLDRQTNILKDVEQINSKAFLYGFIFMPEAFAGLQSLTGTSRLKPGIMHLLVDIGGGTTDVGFFTVCKNKRPNVHIVESFHMGLNYVFEEYLADHPKTTLNDVQRDFQDSPEEYSKYIKIYTSELKNQLSKMVYNVVSEFLKRSERHHVSVTNLYNAMMAHPIVFCGGGSTYPEMRIENQYFSDIYMINKDILNIPNLMNKDIDNSDFTILATSYGLSIPLEEEIQMTDLSDLFEQFCNNIQLDNASSQRQLDYGLQDHN